MSKYAMVTGADRGLGLGLVKNLLGRGYTVFAGRYMPVWKELDEVKAEYSDNLVLLDLDISSDESVKKASEEVKKNCPHLNLLVNNAGITGDITSTLFEDLDFNDMLNVYNVNTLGPLRVTHAMIDHVLKSEEKFVLTISSEAGSIEDCWREYWFGYGMSKAAINMQGAIVHNAISSKGGKVMLIHPGHVRSYMSGEFNTKGAVTADDSASAILKLALDTEVPETRHPIYQNFRGEALPW